MSHAGLVAVLLGLGLAWGVSIPLTKVAVSTGHQPLGLIFWQLVFSTTMLGAISALRRVAPPLDRRALGYFLVIGSLGTILPNSFSYLAAARLPAGVMAIAIATVPMFSLSIALGLGLERLSARRAAGVVLGAVAVILIVAPEASLPDPDQAIFVLVALIAPLCYGAEGNYIATRAPRNIDPVATLLGASAIAAAIAGPLAWFTGTWVDLGAPWGWPERALLGSSMCHVVAYTGYVWLVGAAGAVFSSQVAYVVTISGVFLSALLLGEHYSAWVWTSLALMIGGLALVQPREARAPAPFGDA